MASFCHNCGRQVREDMVFCPACGVDLTMFDDDRTPPAYQGAGHPQVPPLPAQLPQAPYPFPMYYRAPMTGQRMMVLAGAIILIIDGILASLMSLIMVLGLEMFYSGSLLLAASVMAFVSASFAIASFNPIYILVGPLMLIVGAIVLMAAESEAIAVVIVGSSLAAVSLLLLVLGWRDSVARYQARQAGQHPSLGGFRPSMAHPQAPVYGSPEPPSVLRVKK